MLHFVQIALQFFCAPAFEQSLQVFRDLMDPLLSHILFRLFIRNKIDMASAFPGVADRIHRLQITFPAVRQSPHTAADPHKTVQLQHTFHTLDDLLGKDMKVFIEAGRRRRQNGDDLPLQITADMPHIFPQYHIYRIRGGSGSPVSPVRILYPGHHHRKA